MTGLTDMWAALEAHQHIADRSGYGKEWARMCNERTYHCANAAARAAYAAAADAAAYAAAYAAADAARAARAAAAYAHVAADAISRHSKRAIAYITQANDGLAYVRSVLTEGEKM